MVVFATFLVLAGLCSAAAAPDGSKILNLPNQIPLQPQIGASVDVAPFGELRSWKDGNAVGVVWEDTRDIFRVVVKFVDKSKMPEPSNAKVQYWKGQWPQERMPRDENLGSGKWGWIEAGDWYNGVWRDADTQLEAKGDTWTFTFNPINKSEYNDVEGFDAKYRTTLKLRVMFDKAPQVAGLNAFTDSTWQKTTAIVEWGGNAVAPQVWDGRTESFNGYITSIKPLETGKTAVSGGGWTSTVNGTMDGVSMDISYAKPIAMNSYDETIATIRAKQQSFSFLAREVAEGKRLFIRDYGVLVRPLGDKTTFAECEAAYAKAPKDVYRRVKDMPEQTLSRAWSNMPAKGVIYMPLTCEGSRQVFRLRPDCDIQLNSYPLRRAKGPDTGRTKWTSNDMIISLGLDLAGRSGASIEDGVLPIATSWRELNGVRYSLEAFATPLAGALPKEGRVSVGEPIALMIKIRATNTTGVPQGVALPMRVKPAWIPEKLVMKDNVIYGNSKDGEFARLHINPNGFVQLYVEGNSNILMCKGELPPGAAREYYVTIPFLTPNTPKEIQQLNSLNYDAQHKMIAAYWRKRLSQGCSIVTPEPMINAFYASNPMHQLVNCESEAGDTGRLMPKVGTFAYGVYGNESIMMTTELDRRGYNDVSEKALESFIHYQGTKNLPGDFTSSDGEFYAAGGYEEGGYNQSHGWAMWGIAEHYWFTRDKVWLTRVAPNLVKACNWIIEQRARTKTDECAGMRSIEYGLMPPGSLEDIGDWRSWMSNNDFTYWGMQSVALALADIGHPDAQRFLKEAAEYKKDIRTAFFEAMYRSPVVALRDGTYIPSMPSDVHRRGRSLGWITETLEGSIYMIRCGLVAPDEPLAKWIMQDYEDNRYISAQFGYQTPYFERDWFSIGGFSQQPSLLCSPTPYIMRDEPEHYLRAYFNAFAAGYFPERAMLTEHPLPNLGDYKGDHFKTSDEALNTSWIRNMFVWDEGTDLYLGKVMPRYWLADGKEVKIERTQTHFGPMSMTMKSNAASGKITMTIDPPTRNAPGAVYARFRHPEGKAMNRVTVDGKSWDKFDPAKEWVILPPLKARTVVVAYYE